MSYKRTDNVNLKDYSIDLLKRRGVELTDMAQIAYDLQKKYMPNLNLDECLESVKCVIAKTETQNAIITGIELDMLAEEGKLSNVLGQKLNTDDGLYGIDEINALSIVNMYGSIALTAFGYVDKLKPGIIGKLDSLGKNSDMCTTFIDDIVGAIAASAASRVAHNKIGGDFND